VVCVLNPGAVESVWRPVVAIFITAVRGSAARAWLAS